MKRLLLIFITLQLCAASALAETPRLLCDKPVELVAPLTSDGIEQIVASTNGRNQALEGLSTAYESTLSRAQRSNPGVKLFLEKLRVAGSTEPAVWDIGPDPTDDSKDLLFGRFDEVVSFDCDRPIPPYQMNMAYLAGVVKKLLQPGAAAETRPMLDVILSRSQQAENLLNNGLPMWPWENYINGRRLGTSDAEPLFTTQWVVMRPSAALQFNTRSRADATLSASLIIEPIGFVRYTDRTYKSWWGASAVVSINSESGAGYGALLRYGKFTLGLTLQKSSTPDKKDDVYVLLGMDLYDLLNNQRQALSLP